MSKISHAVALSILLIPTVTFAGSGYIYNASCEGSYHKQGEIYDDLTKVKGKDIKCDSVILTFHDNGNILVQLAEKKGKISPLGFGGNGWDYQQNPNLVTLKVDRIYVPHSSNPEKPQIMNGVDGFCFFDGELNIRKLSKFSCATKMEIGTQKVVYSVKVSIKSVGEQIPW